MSGEEGPGWLMSRPALPCTAWATGELVAVGLDPLILFFHDVKMLLTVGEEPDMNIDYLASVSRFI
jgi:hypothetical protein